jgi:signal transduction histidine kinase
MREFWRSAAYRLAFGYTALCALAVLATGSAVYYAASAMVWRDFDHALTEEVTGLRREYAEGGLPDLTDALTRHAKRPGNAYRYALFDRGGSAMLGQSSLPSAQPGWGEAGIGQPGQHSWHARFFAERLPGGETLIVAADTKELDGLRNRLLGALAVGFIAILGLGATGTILFGRHLRRRLETISSTADAIVAGDLQHRVSVGPSGDEFDRAGASLNSMLDRIAQLVENLRQVSSDVAHDLRTPLQRLRGAVESGLSGPQQTLPLRAALESASEQSDAVLALFEAILRICEVEAGGARERFETVDIAALARRVCEMYGPAIDDGGRTLACESQGAILVLGDRELLVQMMTNLLDNAVLHTPEGTAVTVSARQGGSQARLIVADTGPGVPESDRERIVQRFVRLDRSRMTNGHGLGLNLVAAIASAHGGRLVIEDNCPGLRADISLPVADMESRVVPPGPHPDDQ